MVKRFALLILFLMLSVAPAGAMELPSALGCKRKAADDGNVLDTKQRRVHQEDHNLAKDIFDDVLDELTDEVLLEVFDEQRAQTQAHLANLKLCQACSQGNVGEVRKQLRAGADANQKVMTDSFNCTLLHVACIQGYMNIARSLLRYDAQINAQDHQGATPLHYALAAGNNNIAQLLVEADADIEVADQDGLKPLRLACIKGNVAMVVLLLAHGAYVFDGSLEGQDLVQVTIEQCQNPETQDEIIGRLYFHQMNELFRLACLYDDIDNAKRLLEGGIAQLNQADHTGATALHFACAAGNVAVVRWLLEQGADPDATTDDQQTPLSVTQDECEDEEARTQIIALLNSDQQEADGQDVVGDNQQEDVQHNEQDGDDHVLQADDKPSGCVIC